MCGRRVGGWNAGGARARVSEDACSVDPRRLEYVKGGFLVRVGRTQRGHNLGAPVPRQDELYPQLGDVLELPKAPDGRVGAFDRPELTGPGSDERALAVSPMAPAPAWNSAARTRSVSASGM